MGELYLPVLSHFQNGNTWLASLGRLRFKVTPGEETLTAETWEGPWSYEFSALEEERAFPLSEEGIEDLRAWLLTRAEDVSTRPERSMEEDLKRRVDTAASS